MNAMGSIDSRISALVTPSANRKSVSADGELANKFKNLLSSKAEMAEFRKQELSGSSQATSGSSKVAKQDKLTTNGYGDIPYKLSELQKIHEETDYSGMSDLEIYRTIRGRFERAFPNLKGKTIRMMTPKESGLISVVRNQQYKDKIKDESLYNVYSCKEEAERERLYFGYENLSDDEIIRVHKENFVDDGSIDAKGQFLVELSGLGVINPEIVSAFGLSANIACQKAYRTYFKTNVDCSDLHSDWVVYEFGNQNMSWTEAKEMVLAEKEKLIEIFGENIIKEIESLFDSFIEDERKWNFRDEEIYK